MLEWEKKMQKIIKCKLVDPVEHKFNLVKAILEGYTLIHWLEFKQVEIAQISKSLDGTDMPPLGMCNLTFMMCLQELKKNCFQKNLSCLKKAYLCNHIKNQIN
eukprot:14865160-Ditylum_brightwellii.AAC.1